MGMHGFRAHDSFRSFDLSAKNVNFRAVSSIVAVPHTYSYQQSSKPEGWETPKVEGHPLREPGSPP